METNATAAIALEPRQTPSQQGSHAPSVGRDVHARLGGVRPNQDVDLPPFWGEDGFTFDDLVDLMNPLHHIPLVGPLYRNLTGDQIAAGPRIMGGALFAGGPIGAMVAAAGNAVNAGVAHETGNDIGGHVWAWLGIGDDNDTGAPPVPVPANNPVELAEIDDLPWLNLGPVASIAAEPVLQTVTVATEPLLAEPLPNATLAAASTHTQTPIGPPADQTKLSDHQWAMLVASLEPQEVAHAESRTAEAPTTTQQPADLAAAMVRALDKYEALARARSFDDLAE